MYLIFLGILAVLVCGLIAWGCCAVSSRCSREEERECPYPIKGDDGTISDCIKQGHCACDEGGTK